MSAVRAPAPRRTGARTLPGGSWTAWGAALAVAAIAALAIADDAGVAGPAALPEVARALLASVAVLAVCGFPLARLLVPESIAAWRPLLVLPLGAVGCALALTLLGFAFVPFGVSLPLVLAAAVAGCVLTARRPAGGSPAPAPHLLGLAALGLLVVAIALVPTFRSGVVTVTGFGSDAHMAAGTAFFLQHEHPTGHDAALPIDEVTPAWRSKFPIYYALAAVSSVAGMETWEMLMTFGAVMLALAGAGFFLLAHRSFRAGVGVAAVAAAAAILDQRVLHLPMHPYYNQLWGLFTLPFSLVFAHLWFEERTRKMLALLVLFTLMGALAYPLMLPFPGLVIAGAWVMEQRSRGERVLPQMRGRRLRWWMVPVGVLLAVPIFGVLEKIGQGIRLLGNLDTALEDWQGDLAFHPPVGEFLTVADVPGRTLLVVLVCLLAVVGVRRMSPRVGTPLLVTLVLAGMAGAFFGLLNDGQYLYFKILAFAGPLIVVAAVVAVGSLRGRLWPVALAGLALFSFSALAGARDEIALSFDQLTPQAIELGAWAERLPPGSSVRLDTPPPAQLWEAYMLSDLPLGSRRPNPHYPHVPRSQGADYALDWVGRTPPADSTGPPLFTNSRHRLWRLDGSGGRDTTSRRQFSGGVLGSLADPG